MTTEPDLRPPSPASKEPDWDTLDASYEAPGARDVVPQMPPIPDVTTPHPPEDNWAWAHYDDAYHKPRKAFPTPNREIISEENPLEVDVYYSMRSPYSYLSLFRLAYLHSNFNVNVNVKVIFPIAARTAKPGQKSALGGRWYFWGYSVGIDMARTGRYEGIPWRFANPDPILADTYPPESGTQITAPMERQPYITWLVRLGSAAQMQGKALDYCLAVSPLIWGAQTKIGEWPFHIEAAVNSIGMNYNAVIKDIQANSDKYDDVWQQNQVEFQATGQGGVPTMSFNGEPFFGLYRFDLFFWRLRQNGLTVRKVPREPIVTKPIRWPEGI
jgi:2-hydroxychromene-2-carboxylate isomerase